MFVFQELVRFEKLEHIHLAWVRYKTPVEMVNITGHRKMVTEEPYGRSSIEDRVKNLEARGEDATVERQILEQWPEGDRREPDLLAEWPEEIST